MSDNSYVLDITWSDADMPGLPRFVGPFDTADEAGEWAELNAARATYTVQPLAYPYMRTGDGSHLWVGPTIPSNRKGGNDAGI